MKPLGSVVHINPKTERFQRRSYILTLECVESGVLNSKNFIATLRQVEHKGFFWRKVIYSIKWFDRIKKNHYYFKRILNIAVASTGYAQIRCSGWTLRLYTSNFRQTILPVKQCFAVRSTGYPAINADDLAEILFGFLHLINRRKSVRLILLGQIEVHQKLLSTPYAVKSSLFNSSAI